MDLSGPGWKDLLKWYSAEFVKRFGAWPFSDDFTRRYGLEAWREELEGK